MSDINENLVKQTLDKVLFPNGKSLIANGYLQSVSVRGDIVHLVVELPDQFKPAMQALRGEIESSVKKLPNVKNCLCVFTAHNDGSKPAGAKPASAKPTNNHGHEHHGHAHNHSPAGNKSPFDDQSPVPGVKKIIAVASGKGGVGKSTTSVNLAMALRNLGQRVALLDADIYGPSVPRMVNNKDTKPQTAGGEFLLPVPAFGIQCMSIGFMVAETQPTIWRGPMVMSAIQQMLFKVKWEDIDIMVIDLPPGTGDAQLSLVQKVPLSGAVIVSTPQDIALIDARKAIAMFQKVNVPILGIVENMAYFICNKCSERHEIFANGGAKLEAKTQNVPFLGEIPLEAIIRETSDKGQPIVDAAPNSESAKCYLKIAQKLLLNGLN